MDSPAPLPENILGSFLVSRGTQLEKNFSRGTSNPFWTFLFFQSSVLSFSDGMLELEKDSRSLGPEETISETETLVSYQGRTLVSLSLCGIHSVSMLTEIKLNSQVVVRAMNPST